MSAEVCWQFQYKTDFLTWSADPDDTKMLLDILLPMNHIIIDQLTLIQSVYPHLFCSVYDNGSPLY